MIDAFWISVGFIIYPYIVYPLLLWLLTVLRRTPVYSCTDKTPALTMVVAAYNEADVIADKLENSLALDYPPDQLQIIVASDCSDDRTDAIVAEYEDHGVSLVRLGQRSGKTVAQNEAVRHAKGDILVFSDANSMYDQNALRELVIPFCDDRVGCVCGELRYLNPEQRGAGKGEGFYWRYEQFLKRRESLLGALVGANGSIYALRRRLFEELDPDVISDLIMPVCIKRRGFLVVYCPEAIAREYTPKRFTEEFRRRSRIVARSAYGLLWKHAGVLNPLTCGLFAWQVWSHKVLRWIVPLFLILAFVASAISIKEQPYREFFVSQAIFYGLALIGLLAPMSISSRGLFYLPAYFCSINAGALMGLWGFVTRNRYRVWESVDRCK